MDIAPEATIAKTAFREKAVNMRAPFEIPAERMQNHNKTRSEILGLIEFKEHTGNDTVYCMKKAVKQRAIQEKEVSESFVDSKNTMTVSDTN